MNLRAIAHARLNAQEIAVSTSTTVKELVTHMGALQAQDYNMAKWAIGLRLPGSTEKQVDRSFAKGEIIRAHVLRPTWHIIPAADIYWMLSISAVKIKVLMKTMDKQLELTEKIFNRSTAIIEKSLQQGKQLTREELAENLEKGNIPLRANRLSHLLMRAELEGIACSGQLQGNKKTYALLEDCIPKKKLPHKEEALALLAERYFNSHGPATLQDFTWWSGLSVTSARQALESVKCNFISEKINGGKYWFDQHTNLTTKNKPAVHLLPAFDEFIISYKDRTAAMAKNYHTKILSINGIFNPVIIVNGQVTGLWKRTLQKDQLVIETDLFKPHSKAIIHLIEKKASALAKFLGKKETLLPNV